MKIRKNISTLALGNGISHGITFFGILILSRIYSPENFGHYAVLFGSVTILSAVASFRYEVTILTPKNKNSALLALQVSLFTTLATTISVFSIVLLMILCNLIELYWLLFPITAFFSSIINVSSFLQNRNLQYKRIVCIQVGRALLFILTSFSVYYLGLANNGLIIGMTASYVIPGMWLLSYDIHASNAYSVTPTRKQFAFWIKRHIKFFHFSTPAVFVSTLASQTPVFLLSYFLGEVQSGYYSMLYRIVMAPVILISIAINRVYMQTVSSKKAAGKNIYPFTLMLVKKSTIPGLLISAVMLVIFHFEILEKILGTQWMGIDALASVMVPAFLFSFIAKTISGFAVLGRNELGLFFQLILLTSLSAAVIFSAVTTGETFVVFSCISLTFSLCYFGQGFSILKISRMIDQSNNRKVL